VPAHDQLSTLRGHVSPSPSPAQALVGLEAEDVDVVRMGRLLEADDLNDTSSTYRWGALWCLENLDECRRHLDSLPEAERAFHNFLPHVRGLVIAARAAPQAGDDAKPRSPAEKLELVATTLKRHFPLASDDACMQAAADAIESYCGHALPETLNRKIGGRVPKRIEPETLTSNA
jgi:hypothetical protein